MATYLIQHSFQGASGDSKDTYVNTFHYTSDRSPAEIETGTTLVGDNISTMVRNFYTLMDSTPNSIQLYYHECTMMAGETVKIYDVHAPTGTGPLYTYINPVNWTTVTPPGNRGLPCEVAVCLSYSAIDGTLSARRRRGRIYLGPLTVAAIEDLDSNEWGPFVSGAFLNVISNMAATLKTSMEAYDSPWCVYSRADDIAIPIQYIRLDNAFDTIRNRGQAQTTWFGVSV